MNVAASGLNASDLAIVANRLRRDVLRSTNEAGSGHPTSCFSCAEIMATLFFSRIEIDKAAPRSLANDHFVLSKGHAAPILWAVLKEGGAIDDDDLLDLREFESEQEGHPTPRSEWVQVATGSLGQGLSSGLGMALLDKREGRDNRTYVLSGDGEMAEGSVWEAASLAPTLGLSNLTLIVDVNGYGQTGKTLFGHDAEVYRRRLEAFGWNALVVDGHDVSALTEAFDRAEHESDRPTAIVAKTVKGKGVASLEGERGSHGKAAPDFEEALAELPDESPTESAEFRRPSRNVSDIALRREVSLDFPADTFPDDEEISPRKVFGAAVEQLGEAEERLWVFDGDVSNSTYTKKFQSRFEDRFVEGYIAEQNMVGMATGLGSLGCAPLVATFAAFLTRAHDQIRMAAVSRSKLMFAGTHVGIATGQDGPSQMGMEDVAMFRSLPGSVVLQPSDPRCVYGCLELMSQHDGLSYIRLFRPGAPTLRKEGEYSDYRIGGSHTLRSSDSDQVALVGSGITTHYALEAADQLGKKGISARVVDCYSLKPVDGETLRDLASRFGRIVVVEDHYEEGGLGESVFSAIRGVPCGVTHLCVRGVPRSGSQDRLSAAFGIDAESIATAARELCGSD